MSLWCGGCPVCQRMLSEQTEESKLTDQEDSKSRSLSQCAGFCANQPENCNTMSLWCGGCPVCQRMLSEQQPDQKTIEEAGAPITEESNLTDESKLSSDADAVAETIQAVEQVVGETINAVLHEQDKTSQKIDAETARSEEEKSADAMLIARSLSGYCPMYCGAVQMCDVMPAQCGQCGMCQNRGCKCAGWCSHWTTSNSFCRDCGTAACARRMQDDIHV